MPKTMRPIAKSQYLVTIANVKGLFSKFEGGDEKYETAEYVDPNDRRKKTTRGALMVENIKLSKPFHPEEDAELVSTWQNFRDNAGDDFTVTVQAINDDKNKTPIGKPRTYYGCQMLIFKRPAVDLGSADAAELEIEMSTDRVEEA